MIRLLIIYKILVVFVKFSNCTTLTRVGSTVADFMNDMDAIQSMSNPHLVTESHLRYVSCNISNSHLASHMDKIRVLTGLKNLTL